MNEMQIHPQAIRWIDHLDPIDNQNFELIKNACLFASTHEKFNTPFASSTLMQGLAMADVLVSLDADSDAIAGSIIYPAIFYDQTLIKTIHEHFDKNICKIITGALQIEVIHHVRSEKIEKTKMTGQQNQIDNLRKMMLAMVDDIRTVLLKLAERLIMLQHVNLVSSEAQKQIAQDTLDYYAPLANRLGIGQLKWQLEDWAFRYLNPLEYQKISKAFHMRQQDRVRLIHKMIAQLKELLEKGNIKNTKISGRIKHIYSIYRKIQRKQVEFENIYDTNAVRILVPTVSDCYTALSLVHAKWTPIADEFDDYITKPKTNGYQSIHTAVTINHSVVEIQIRTIKMHEKAELGVAAHWKYKENKSVRTTEEQKIILLRNLLDWQKNTLDEEKNKTKLYTQAFHDRVYVFSPTGDVFDLAKGATPLDFAYLIHTNVGHRCRGAKVNNVLVPLTYPLQTGDRIEIITVKEGHPSRDWMQSDLGYLKTSHAKQKVRHWFKKQDDEKNIVAGTILWEKIIRQHHLKKLDIEKLVSALDFKNIDSILVALGSGYITTSVILHKWEAIRKTGNSEKEFIFEETKIPTSTSSPTDFSVQGAKHLLTQLAKCCHPIPGDKIMGYITKGRGISVHQKKCRNMIDAQQHRPEKLIDISWENQLDKSYRVNLEIVCEDRVGLVRDISGLMAQVNLPILAMSSRVNTQNCMATIGLTLEVKNIALLQDTIKKIKQVKGVVSVARK